MIDIKGPDFDTDSEEAKKLPYLLRPRLKYSVTDYGENTFLGSRQFTDVEVKNLTDIDNKCSLDNILTIPG